MGGRLLGAWAQTLLHSLAPLCPGVDTLPCTPARAPRLCARPPAQPPHLAEHGGWHDVHLVQQQQAPLARADGLHHLMAAALGRGWVTVLGWGVGVGVEVGGGVGVGWGMGWVTALGWGWGWCGGWGGGGIGVGVGVVWGWGVRGAGGGQHAAAARSAACARAGPQPRRQPAHSVAEDQGTFTAVDKTGKLLSTAWYACRAPFLPSAAAHSVLRSPSALAGQQLPAACCAHSPAACACSPPPSI